ncbi:MAG: tRNA pseudouridine(38-40) synthase TruA [Sulfurovum sp. 17-42-90]|nr:MAG: tRNA pseudouridine(38-40) synthase TruA [Sulfurovum sp. 17-42-90]
MRIKAVIAYDGSHYQGFQKQTSTKATVATALEEALSALQIHSPVTASGRTDAGVHATGQVIHFDLPDFWQDLHKLKTALNRKLSDIHIKHLSDVPVDFHARFCAKRRVYRYVFKTYQPSVFEQAYIAKYEPFDSLILQQALGCFVGRHDFNYFHKTGSLTHTTVRYHCIYFEANGFLRSQVRMMVDAALVCAREEMDIEALQEQLACQKKHRSQLAPASGLYLARIIY